MYRAFNQPLAVMAMTCTVLAVTLAACSSGSSPGTRLPVANAGAAPAVAAWGTLTITIPKAVQTNGARRTPTYVSAATQHVALFINGATSPAATLSSCSGSCTLNWSIASAVPASYVFAVEVDTGSTGSPANTVLAENSAMYVIHAGTNTLSTLTLNGVAAGGAISNEGCDNNAPSTSASTCSGTLTIEDAAGDTITTPGANFDNAPVTLASSNASVGQITTGSFSAMNATGTYTYTFTCQTNTNTFTVSASSGSGSGAVTSAQLANIGVSYPSTTMTLSWPAHASSTYICRTGNAMKKVFFLTSNTSFTVPSDWNNANNSIETIGGGGDGASVAADGGGGGGGGGYAILTNTALLTAGSPYTYQIGSGGATTAAGDTYFCGTGACTDNGTGTFGAGVLVASRYGASATNQTGGAGGAASTKGTTRYAGGTGGSGRANASRAGGGGGGAAGDLGAGKNGGTSGNAAGDGGGGGGGADNGVAGSASTSATGASGGDSGPGGAGGTAGLSGSNGGGGGGGNGGAAPAAGGAGGAGTEWSSSYGSGGGGGGGGGGTGAGAVANGGNGGGYGGGGGGAGNNSARTIAGTAGKGAAGIIIIIYAP